MTGARIDCRGAARDGDRRTKPPLPGRNRWTGRPHHPQANLEPGRIGGPDRGVVGEGLRWRTRDRPGEVGGDPTAGRDDVLLPEPEAESATPAGESSSEPEGLGPDVPEDPGMPPVSPSRHRAGIEGRLADHLQNRPGGMGLGPSEDAGDRRQPRQDRRGSTDRSRARAASCPTQAVLAESSARLRQSRLRAAVSSAPGE
jgi:hypothetical protein